MDLPHPFAAARNAAGQLLQLVSEWRQCVSFDTIRINERFYDIHRDAIFVKTSASMAKFETGKEAVEGRSLWFKSDDVVTRSLCEDALALLDGWSLRATRMELRQGNYLRLCDPSERAVRWWSKEEWDGRPVAMAADIMLAAAGRRPVGESSVAAHEGEIMVWLSDQCTIRTGLAGPGEYVRICAPNGVELHRSVAADWTVDPINLTRLLVITAGQQAPRVVDEVEEDPADAPRG